MPILINGETIDDAVIRAEANSIRPRLFEAMEGEDPRAVEARVKEWARDNVVERVVLRQAARSENGAAVTPAGETDEQAVERLLTRVTAHVARPRNKDITEFYRKNKEQFVAPETVHAAHIVKNVDEAHPAAEARAAIDDIATRLAAGAPFEALADEVSDCPGRGGDLGFFPRGEMVPEFDAVVFGLQPGEISPVFRTNFGFHIAKLIERRPAGIPRLEDIRDRIEEHLYQQKRQKVIEQFLDNLIAKADVKVV